MSARAAILATVRRGIARSPSEQAQAEQAVATRLQDHPRGALPARADLPTTEMRALFVRQAEAVAATLASVVDREAVPAAVQAYLADPTLLGLEISISADLADLPWQAAGLVPRTGRPDARMPVAVASALAGVAETGTLMLVSGETHSTAANFLPEIHIVVLPAERLGATYEDGWDRLRRERNGQVPRTVNLITGPSRTGDIEQRILLGAHGPRRLHILLVG
jgi:L-lactate dehydrogenase complex protein LldG